MTHPMSNRIMGTAVVGVSGGAGQHDLSGHVVLARRGHRLVSRITLLLPPCVA